MIVNSSYLDAPEHLQRLEEDRADVYHTLTKVEMDDSERMDHLNIEAKPKLSEFKRKLEAERSVIRIYVKGLLLQSFLCFIVFSEAKQAVQNKLERVMDQFKTEIERYESSINEELESQLRIREDRYLDNKRNVADELDKQIKRMRYDQ